MPQDSVPELPATAVYFPLSKRRYTVTPGFFPITTSFGNGAMDVRLFQIDQQFPVFRANTAAARAERFDKYVCFDPDFDRLAPEVCRTIIIRLSVEYPTYFDLRMEAGGAGVLSCRLTGEILRFDREMRLTNVENVDQTAAQYRNAFDALVSQVPEDITVVALPEGKPDENVALHVTAPSHWSPGEKIGASFLQTHAPVPHFGRVAAASSALLETVRTRPPVVRFNWGIEFTDRLNLHPEPPPGTNALEWNRRSARLSDPCPVYLRVERQVLWGMESARALLFAIRVYTRPVTRLSGQERDDLRQTLQSMPEESRAYKGLPPETFTETIQYLSATAT
ncbi:MAG: DUF3445 domain-containing protein [Akkermansiaceae bacterium]|nr:DUF3445 domain-containing protein [Armatimonadota bacterium]